MLKKAVGKGKERITIGGVRGGFDLFTQKRIKKMYAHTNRAIWMFFLDYIKSTNQNKK